MKIVIISTIRNESDILESFVRYHLRFVDRIMLIDHRSTDSSPSILRSLQSEGLSLDVEQESNLDHQQGRILTRLMRRAATEHGADWIIPLDADEFLTVASRGSVRETLERFPANKIIKIPWRTYIPLPTDDAREQNVLMRITQYRRFERHNLRKVLIPRSMAFKQRGFIANGNHGYVRMRFSKEKDFNYIRSDDLVLAHYPVRSSEQIIAKTFAGWLACLAKPNKQPTENFHLKLLYDRFKMGGRIEPSELTSLALGYMTQTGHADLSQNELVSDPLLVSACSFSLKYTDQARIDSFPLVAQVAEEFAEALGKLRRQELSRNPGGLTKLRDSLFNWKRKSL